MGDGLITIAEARLGILQPGDPRGAPSETRISGAIQLDEEDAYQLEASSRLRPDYLRRIAADAPAALHTVKPQIVAQTSIKGALDNPRFIGSAKIRLEDHLKLFERGACAAKRFETDYDVSLQRAVLSNVDFEELVQQSTIALDFAAPHKISGEISFALNRDSPILIQCLAAFEEQMTPPGQELNESTLRAAVLDSKSTIAFNGTLSPFTLETNLESQFHTSDHRTHSILTADATIDEEKLKVELREQGRFAQIQREAKTIVPAREGEKLATEFETETNSRLRATANYQFASSDLTIPQFEVKRYPIKRLLARAAPFVEEEIVQSVLDVVNNDSLLDSRGKVTFDGKTAKFVANTDFAVRNIELASFAVDALNGSLDIRDKNIEIKDISLAGAAGTVRGAGTVDAAGKIDFVGHTEPIELLLLPNWQEYLPALSGTASVDFNVAGTIGEPRYKAQGLAETKHAARPDSPQTSNFTFSGDNKILSFSGELLDKTATLELSYPLADSASDTLELALKTTEFPIDLFIPTTETAATEPLAADAAVAPESPKVTGAFTYRGPRAEPLLGRGELTIEELLWNTGVAQVTHERPLLARVEDGRLDFSDVELLVNEESITLQGFVDYDSGWQAQLQGSWDLRSLAGHFPTLDQLAGTLRTEIAISGDFDKPMLGGPVLVENGVVTVPLAHGIVGANKINVAAQFSKRRLSVERIDAVVGDGLLSGEGSIENIFDDDPTLGFNLRLDDVAFEPIERLAVQLDGNLFVTKDGPAALSLAGDLEIQEAIYQNTVNLDDVLRAITNFVVGKREQSTEETTQTGEAADLNLSIVANDGLLIETNILQSELRADVDIAGTTAVPRVGGDIEVLDGVFALGSSKFEIFKGKLSFPPEAQSLDPLLDIVGETTVNDRTGEELQVQLAISGTITNPNVAFSSNAGLPENEIVSLLSVGGSIRELAQLEGLIGEEVSYRKIVDPRTELSFRERVSGLATFSQVDIDSKPSQNTGEVVPVLRARKPIDENLDLVLQSEISSDQTSSAKVEYAVTPSFSFIGDWISQAVTEPEVSRGSFGIGARYRKTFPGLSIVPQGIFE